MFDRFKVAGVAAVSIFSASFMMAYGATSAASAQTQYKAAQFEAPVIVAPEVATPVEQTSSLSVQDRSADAAPAAPETETADSLAELVSDWKTRPAVADATGAAEANCLATAVFFEARSESLDGQLAVAHVVIGRARSGRFPTSLCGVVTQPGQFGFVRQGRMPAAPTNQSQWQTAQAIAQIALNKGWRNPAEGALYFHAMDGRNRGWGREMVTKIGHHVFYR